MGVGERCVQIGFPGGEIVPVIQADTVKIPDLAAGLDKLAVTDRRGGGHETRPQLQCPRAGNAVGFTVDGAAYLVCRIADDNSAADFYSEPFQQCGIGDCTPDTAAFGEQVGWRRGGGCFQGAEQRIGVIHHFHFDERPLAGPVGAGHGPQIDHARDIGRFFEPCAFGRRYIPVGHPQCGIAAEQDRTVFFKPGNHR